MQNHYFTLTRPFRDLLLWLREYLEVYPPPGFPNPLVTGEPPLLHGDGATCSLGVQFYALEPNGAVVLLFVAVAQEAHGACRLRMRCHEPSIAGWFWTLLDRLAPTRASGQDQPLPEPPGRHYADSPALPAAPTATTAAATSPPAAPPPEQAEPTPGAEAPQSAQVQRLSPGRKGFTPDEIKALRQRWFSRPPGMSVADFCGQDVVCETTLRKYIKDRWG